MLHIVKYLTISKRFDIKNNSVETDFTLSYNHLNKSHGIDIHTEYNLSNVTAGHYYQDIRKGFWLRKF
jgi:hypothetical protein